MEYTPTVRCIGTVLIAAPFAEEMNRSRRMLSLQGRHLASIGYKVIFPDLFGTGDSGGEFSDTTWSQWRDDLGDIVESMVSSEDSSVWLLGLRLGALLALDFAIEHSDRIAGIVLWNPCTDGGIFIKQFLRLRLMSSILTDAVNRESVSTLLEKLNNGNAIEVGGYELSPDLAREIGQLKLEELARQFGGQLHWLEVVSNSAAPAAPQIDRIAHEVSVPGRDVLPNLIRGPKFWSTAETTIAPNLLAATTDIFRQS